MIVQKTQRLIAFAIFFCCIFVANAQTPVEKYGQLQIKNGKVSDKNGNPVVLRGMSLFWSGYPEGSPYYNSSTIKELRDDWCVDVVRAAMSVETGNTNYVNNASTEMSKIKTVIDACVANGLYVIVDFHTHNAPSYLSQAKTFFTEIANEYGHLPNIIYEPYNEPIWQDWSSTIKPYHNEIISTIRAIDDNNIIVCGTKNYSQDVDVAANDPVTGTNIAYTLHYYANSHKSSLRQKALNAMSKGAAIFVTEYGTCDASGNGGYNAYESQVWWDFLEDHQISSCNWSVSNKSETASILKSWAYNWDNWTDDQLTESGKLVKNYLSSKCNLEVTTGSVTLSFTEDRTQFDIGEEITIDAATTVSNGSIANVVFYSGETEIGTDNTEPYSLSISDLSPGGHDIVAKSYDDANNLIGESPVYIITVVGASNVATTGITDQFETEEQFFELTGGITGTSCATAENAAVAGIFWYEDRDAATPFKAEATRTGNGTLEYVISQEEGAYQVIGFGFGEYCNGSTKEKYTLDLTQNAVLNLNISAPETNTESLDLKFQMKDADGTVLAIKNTVLKTDGTVDAENWYQHEIGFSKNHSAPDYLSLDPGTTSNFVYDFKEALTINNPNNPSFPDDINTDNNDFDFSRVVEIIIIPVNKADVGAPSWAPEAFTDQQIILSGLTLGDPDLGEDICTTPPAPSTSDVEYCQNTADVPGLTATGIEAFPYKWYTSETGGAGSEFAPIPSTSVDGVETYYVSQVVSETSTCESPRTALNVTIVEAPVANAGENQEAIEGPTCTLEGSGSDVGTWALVSGPENAEVTFSPSANAASVTAEGLTEIGDYVFSYSVSGDSPCTETVSEVTVQVETITSVQELNENNIEIYPNPISDNLHIDVSKVSGVESMRVVDMIGRVVFETENEQIVDLNTTNLEQGMYLIYIETESGNIVETVVK